ncbi:MAG: nitroreductase family protein [Candidatus Woesearchaeota archaeon]
METFEAIEKRRSVRDFNDTPVEWEKVGNILRAGQLAPSSGNVQDWKFVAVTDKTTRGALANAALKQHWIAKAPVIIVVYSDPKSTQRFYGLRGEKLYTIQNCAAAIENMLLAATDQGLASCWIGAFDEVMVSKALGAPTDVRPQAMIPIGYTDKEQIESKRHQLVDIVYINSWGGKIVNFDLLMDNFSEVARNKINEAVAAVTEKAPSVGESIAVKGKEKIKAIHAKIKGHIEQRRKKKEEQFEKEFKEELSDEDGNIDDEEDLE